MWKTFFLCVCVYEEQLTLSVTFGKPIAYFLFVNYFYIIFATVISFHVSMINKITYISVLFAPVFIHEYLSYHWQVIRPKTGSIHSGSSNYGSSGRVTPKTFSRIRPMLASSNEYAKVQKVRLDLIY